MYLNIPFAVQNMINCHFCGMNLFRHCQETIHPITVQMKENDMKLLQMENFCVFLATIVFPWKMELAELNDDGQHYDLFYPYRAKSEKVSGKAFCADQSYNCV